MTTNYFLIITEPRYHNIPSKMADMGYIKSKIDSQFSKFANKYRCKYGRLGVKSVEQSVKNTLKGKQTVADS